MTRVASTRGRATAELERFPPRYEDDEEECCDEDDSEDECECDEDDDDSSDWG